MTIVVDTNILFSACLTPDGRIFEILFNTSQQLQIISSYYVIEELNKHKAKLIRLSHHTPHEIEILITTVLKQVDFLNENIIAQEYWVEADRLTKDVDSKDISFVALTLQTNGLLWTGDKKLTDHLIINAFDRVSTTAKLYELMNIS